MSLPKILLIEDDRSMASALAYALHHTYEVDGANNGRLALYKIDTERYDIIVLNPNLPDIRGIIICQQLRARGLRTPILILSDDDKIMTKINLLDAGANDYLTKPFSLGELTARLRVLGRKAQEQQAITPLLQPLSAHGIVLDRQTYSVSRDGVSILLRRKEFDILAYLLEHNGQVVSREELSRYLWPTSDSPWTNTVTVHIKSLRDKVDRPFPQALIQTVHGRGYKLEALEAAQVAALSVLSTID
jgi:two-component system OmpR family response regulator